MTEKNTHVQHLQFYNKPVFIASSQYFLNNRNGTSIKPIEILSLADLIVIVRSSTSKKKKLKKQAPLAESYVFGNPVKIVGLELGICN